VIADRHAIYARAVERCAECGFVYDPAVLERGTSRGAVEPVVQALRDAGVPALRHRETPDTWSALEYGSHLRDVLIAQRERVLLAVILDGPRFVPMHREERVAIECQNEQDPRAVSVELAHAAALFDRTFALLDEEQRSRTGIYNYPEPQPRTVTWIAVHTLHECHHHAGDVARLLARS
jgi:hypothetical protein